VVASIVVGSGLMVVGVGVVACGEVGGLAVVGVAVAGVGGWVAGCGEVGVGVATVEAWRMEAAGAALKALRGSVVTCSLRLGFVVGSVVGLGLLRAGVGGVGSAGG